jgi:Zn-dependent M32 family carboxypeptidase
MRGQLIDGPGYLVNYAIGAIITADLRARMRTLRGSFIASDSTWYPWASQQIYRYGLEKSSLTVLEQFLGGPLAPDAILADMERAK